VKLREWTVRLCTLVVNDHPQSPGTLLDDRVRIREIDIDEPTAVEIQKAIDTINDLAVFAANHGCFTKEVPELVKTTSWLLALANGKKEA
jgi:hypothetical protein